MTSHCNPPPKAQDLKAKDLNGLPSYLMGSIDAILTLLGCKNRHSRKALFAQLKHSNFLKRLRKNNPQASDEQLIEAQYSLQIRRFDSFWTTVARKYATPIEVAGRMEAPDILIFLLHAYEPSCFDAVYDENCIGALNVDQICKNANAAFDSANLPESSRKGFDLRYLNLWEKLLGDIENIVSLEEGRTQQVAGAVFALASIYNSPELIDEAIQYSTCHLLPYFAPFIQESPTNKSEESHSDQIKEWGSLVIDLQHLVARLADDTSSELLDEIETTFIELRKAAALRQTDEVDNQWIDQFFISLRGWVEQPNLKWFAEEIKQMESGCLKSELSSSQLKVILVPIENTLPKLLAQYRELSEAIRDKKDSIAEVDDLIEKATIQDRPHLRLKENTLRGELNDLRDRQSEVELELTKVQKYLADKLLPQALDVAPSIRTPKIATDTPKKESPQSSTHVPESPQPSPEMVIPQPPSPVPKPVTLPPDSAPVHRLHPVIPEPALLQPEALHPEPLTSGHTIESPPPKHIESTTLSDLPTTAALLTILAQNPTELADTDWITLGHVQRGWLARRQPLRAWMLSSAAERLCSSTTESIQILALLPTWACRLLLVLSDAKLPLSDEETECLYKIRTLDHDQKELMTLWLTATLLEGATDKPLRIVRLVSPVQFDLAPHSLAQCCAEHLLTPVYNGGSLRPQTSRTEFDRQYQQAINDAQDLLNPSRNNYQKKWVNAFWRDLTVKNGRMGQILVEAKQKRFPPKTLSSDVILEGLSEWSDILAAYKRNMKNRIDVFAGLIEDARAAHDSAQGASMADQSMISKHAVQEILAGIQRHPDGGWWLETIRSGMSDL